MARRAFVVVLDAVGAGATPDTAAFGDPADSDTLVHVAAEADLAVPALERLGIGCIRALRGVLCVPAPVLHGRLRPQGPGKESTTGHWELMGVITPHDLPTYPDGFPPAVLRALEPLTGPLLCNRPFSGTAVLEAFGEEHLRSGHPILYTSADSVLQLAVHRDVLDEPALHALCRRVREEVMVGEHAVGRVIARPFVGTPGAWTRTEGRKDLAVRPPGRSYLEELRDRGLPVHAVGKTYDLFAGVGFSDRHPGASNATALAETGRLIDELDAGVCFTNLIETDQLYGHRKDVPGFARALATIDAAVGTWVERLRSDDLLILTADHGVDPRAPHTDHTREHVPLLAAFAGHGGRRHDGPMADVGASVVRWLTGEDVPALPGTAFVA